MDCLNDRARTYNALVVNETVGNLNRSNRISDDSIWVTVFWSGEQAGSRILLLPNEPAVPVNTRCYFQSNLQTYCNFTDETIDAGEIYMIVVDYNTTTSIRFSFNQSNRVYNIYTLSGPDDYEPSEVVIDLAKHFAWLTQLSLVCAAVGMLAVFAAVKVRSA